jgi:cysteinyl-tRNA synthetase
MLCGMTLMNVAKYVTKMLNIFGLIPESPGSDIGFPLGGGLASVDGSPASGESSNKETLLAPYLDALTRFRETVRLAAIAGDTGAVLRAADHLRDVTLSDLGVRMEDKGSGADVVTVWKLDDPEKMRLEREQKEFAKAEKLRAKEEAAIRQREKDERAKIPPEQMFRNQTELYSAFDATTGVPTHNAAGEELSKGSLKKLQKDWEKQKEQHEKYLEKTKPASTV